MAHDTEHDPRVDVDPRGETDTERKAMGTAPAPRRGTEFPVGADQRTAQPRAESTVETDQGTARADTDELRQARAETQGEPPSPRTGQDQGQRHRPALFQPQDVERLRMEWQRVQAMFVDDPRESVRTADSLLTEVISGLDEQRRALRQGGEAHTEDLRLTLHRYRQMLDRLLQA